MEPFNQSDIAVIFISQRAQADSKGYVAAAAAMEREARHSPGYLGLHYIRGSNGIGIAISYWQNEHAALAWKAEAARAALRAEDRPEWYDYYEVSVAEICRSCDWK